MKVTDMIEKLPFSALTEIVRESLKVKRIRAMRRLKPGIYNVLIENDRYTYCETVEIYFNGSELTAAIKRKYVA